MTNKDPEIFEKIEKKKKELMKIIERERKTSSTKKREKWEDFKYYKDGRIVIRCQAKLQSSHPPRQCPYPALKGRVVCRRHTGVNLEKKKEIRELKKSLGLYDIGKDAALQKELRELEGLAEEDLTNTLDELKLSVVVLRKFLKAKTDDEIAENPGKLMWLLDNIVRFKKTHWEMKHAPKVSFTVEQVEYMFMKFRNIIIDVVKDPEMLSNISRRVQELGAEIRAQGFKK